MSINPFWFFLTFWLLPFVVINILQSRKNWHLNRWYNPLRIAITELMIFGGATIISVAYFLYLYITSEPSLFSSFSFYILVGIVVVFANALIKFLRLKRWINKHSNYAILAFDTPTSWIKSIRCLHIGKLDGVKETKGKAFFTIKAPLLCQENTSFVLIYKSDRAKLSSIYIPFIWIST